jgi:hypothetical protein
MSTTWARGRWSGWRWWWRREGAAHGEERVGERGGIEAELGQLLGHRVRAAQVSRARRDLRRNERGRWRRRLAPEGVGCRATPRRAAPGCALRASYARASGSRGVARAHEDEAAARLVLRVVARGRVQRAHGGGGGGGAELVDTARLVHDARRHGRPPLRHLRAATVAAAAALRGRRGVGIRGGRGVAVAAAHDGKALADAPRGGGAEERVELAAGRLVERRRGREDLRGVSGAGLM